MPYGVLFFLLYMLLLHHIGSVSPAVMKAVCISLLLYGGVFGFLYMWALKAQERSPEDYNKLERTLWFLWNLGWLALVTFIFTFLSVKKEEDLLFSIALSLLWGVLYLLFGIWGAVGTAFLPERYLGQGRRR
jgi:hypothetical protein